jgi:hypothetical protein
MYLGKAALSVLGLFITLVMQAQVSKTIEITAGTLSTALSLEEKNTVTQLTLTGTIDARDFKTMRDSMPLLAKLELSNTSIGAYSGAGGTLENFTEYPADEIPQSSFSGKTILSSIDLPFSTLSIGYYAFYSCTGLDSINIPNMVTTIKMSAFSGCTQLGSAIIPASVNYIGVAAFTCCQGLSSIIIPSSVTTIATNAFSGCTGLLSVSIPSSLNSIWDYTFNGCSSLTKITIPSTITSIGYAVFANCNNLTSISLPSAINHIGGYAFYNCTDLDTIKSYSFKPIDIVLEDSIFNGIDKIRCLLYVPLGTKALYQAANQWKDFQNIFEMAPDYEMPLNVTAGGLAALLPKSVRDTMTYLALSGTIDARDFKTMRDSLPMLAEIDLSGTTIVEYYGENGTSIWDNNNYLANAIPEFAFCNSNWEGKRTLTSISLPIGITTIGNVAFRDCQGLQSIIIPDMVTTIGYNIFQGCSNIPSIIIPATVTSIHPSAFSGDAFLINVSSSNPNYSSLDGVLFNKEKTGLLHYPSSLNGLYSIPQGVETIEGDAFIYCDIDSVSFPSSIKSIKFQAFWGCTNLSSLYFPSTISSIQAHAFGHNSGLTSIYTGWQVPLDLTSSPDVFTYVDKSTITLYVPYGSKPLYQAANQWMDFQNIIEMAPTYEMPLNVTAGGLAALLPQSVRDTMTYLALIGTIDARDFKTMRDSLPVLANLDLSGVSIVEYYGAEGTSIQGGTSYPANAIPEFAFMNSSWQGKTSLTSIVFPENLTSIGQYALRYCSGLTSIVIPEGVTSIGGEAFRNCSNLTSISIPVSVSLIGSSAFENCTGLTSIFISEGVTSIGEGAFWGIGGLIIVDDNNQYFSDIDGVLYDKDQATIIQCPNSKAGSFDIPKTVTSIGYSAFENCTDLTSISIPTSVKSIYSRTFLNCRNLTSIIVKNTIPVDLSSSTLVFLYIDKTNCTLFVPSGSKSAYQAASQWQDFQNIVEMPPIDLSDGLVAYYPFNGNAHDESGNNFNGTIEGQTTFNSGILGDAASFRGNSVGDYIAAANSLDSLSEITISSWVKVSDFDLSCWYGGEAILSRGDPNASNFFGLWVYRNEDPECGSATSLDSIGFRFYFSNSVAVFTKKSYNPNSWYHVVATYNGNRLRIFVDNKLITENNEHSGLKLLGQSRFLINKHEYYSNGRMGGLIDEVRLYNRALNEVEIDSLYKQGTTANQPPLANAGPDQTVPQGALVTLDGSGSSDPGNLPLAYRWTAPEGVVLSSDTARQPTFTAPVLVEKSQVLEIEPTPPALSSQVINTEPFISEVVFRAWWSTTFVEVVNPGDQPVDLSRYLLVYGWESPDSAIASHCEADSLGWKYRYNKYVPGKKWEGYADWVEQPGLLINDPSVASIIEPRQVFTIGGTGNTNAYHLLNKANVQFKSTSDSFEGTFMEGTYNTLGNFWLNANIYLFKITNDSVCSGLKPANNPSDFQLVDAFGWGNLTDWYIAGTKINQNYQIIRKPSVSQGNTALGTSFGTNPEDSEWQIFNEVYYMNNGYGWPQHLDQLASNLGTHQMDDFTVILSTVTSPVYLVSDGDSFDERIGGIAHGTRGEIFLNNLIKGNPEQTLTLIDRTTGQPQNPVELIEGGDSLLVVSANGLNQTKYILGTVGTSEALVFTLTVDNGIQQSASDTTVVIIQSENLNDIPFAILGPDQVVQENTQVQLNGSQSYDPDGTPLTFSWTTPEEIVLNDPSAPNPTFTAPSVNLKTYYRLVLTVSDGTHSQSAEMKITVVPDNAPLAVMMRTTKASGSEFYFSVSCSTPSQIQVDWGNGVLVNYEIYNQSIFNLAQISGTTASDHAEIKIYAEFLNGLNSEQMQLDSIDVSFNPGLQLLNCSINQIKEINLHNNPHLSYLDIGMNHQLTNLDVSVNRSLFSLICQDCNLGSLNLSNNTSLNELNCEANHLTSLDFSTNTNIYSINCAQNQLTSLSLQGLTNLNRLYCYGNLLDACALDDLFRSLHDNTGNGNGNIYIKCSLSANGSNPGMNTCSTTLANNRNWKVMDFDGNIDSPEFEGDGTGCPINHAPVANAGPNQIVDEGTIVTLDGSASTDPDDEPLTYLWTAPAGITLSSDTASRPTFTAPEVNEINMLRFTLVVNDGTSNSQPDTVYVKILNIDETQHFTPVWTGNGVDHMNLNVVTALQDLQDLQAGDEIGVFDGNLCGVGVLTAPLSQTNVLPIAVSRNDGSGNGYTVGHNITYKFYDQSAGKEFSPVTPTYYTTNPAWSSDGKFAIGATAFVDLSAVSTMVPSKYR